jgi:hypothetical protein
MKVRSHLSRFAVLLAIAGATLAGGVLTAGTAVAEPGNGQAVGQESGNGAANANNQGNGQAIGHQTSGTAGTTGDPTSPQPPSNADNSGNGANVTGPYTSTRDGSPSMNGNGNGLAVGQPCAGCVGQADNKNPPGQMPNGSDPNAGYECDSNNGIGQTNPAHTGCTTTGTPPPVVVPPDLVPPELSPPLVLAEVTVRGAAEVSPAEAQAATALAFTGSNSLRVAAIGALAFLLGLTALLAGTRRRERALA